MSNLPGKTVKNKKLFLQLPPKTKKAPGHPGIHISHFLFTKCHKPIIP